MEICWQRIRGIVARRYADTSSRNRFRLSEKPSVIKMTPTINLRLSVGGRKNAGEMILECKLGAKSHGAHAVSSTNYI